MANITLAVPDELHKRMKKYPEIRWSEVIRKTIDQRTKDLELLDKLTSKSTLTQQEADEIADKIKHSMAKRLLK